MILNLRKLFHLPKKETTQIPNKEVPKGLIRTGYAEVVQDKESGGFAWKTFGVGDVEGEELPINETLHFPPHLFTVGTRIEILEKILLDT